ncbi:MAG: hypothetical protein WCJ30_10435 [Deltaproteobacteria bacterium]
MDQTLVTGLLSIATVASSAVVGVFSFAAKRHVANFDRLTDNDTKKTEHLGALVMAVQSHAVRLESIEATIVDGRQSKATDAQNEATAVMKTTIALVTGKHAAVDAERADLMRDDREVELPSARGRSGSRAR